MSPWHGRLARGNKQSPWDRHLARRVSAWLKLCRISNLPTVWSNALLGLALGASSSDTNLVITPSVLVILSLSLLYTAGMILNDAFDADIDRIERPSRPIPSGHVSRVTAFMFGASLLAIGVGLAFAANHPAGIHASVLTACIIAYNAIHARTASSIILMAACRALAVLTAASALSVSPDPATISVAVTIGIYTLAISLLARDEALSQTRAPSITARALLPVGPVIAWFVLNQAPTLGAGAIAIITLGWLGLVTVRAVIGRRVPAVLAALAGFSLVDTALLAALDQPQLASVALLCFILTTLAHKHVPGT
ncbi:MAG: UbiA family prenyltransferase [Planctomycetota bacterium]